MKRHCLCRHLSHIDVCATHICTHQTNVEGQAATAPAVQHETHALLIYMESHTHMYGIVIRGCLARKLYIYMDIYIHIET